MKIRSITTFFTPETDSLDKLADFSRRMKEACVSAGFAVETIRLAGPPFAAWLPHGISQKIAVLQQLESSALALGYDFISAGPALPDDPDAYNIIPALLENTRSTFFSGVIAAARRVYPPAVRACAQVIHAAAALETEGFANLRFAALANVPAQAPFFPAAYHAVGEGPAFSLAMESADEAVSAFSGAGTLEDALSGLLHRLNGCAQTIAPLCAEMAQRFALQFKGFDFSLAPFPGEDCSLGKAFELLGLEHVGGIGALSAAACIADALDRGEWPHVGFNGLMLPVLEDTLLAARAAQGVLTVQDLLLYSAVCGTGLDTVPLPGDTSQNALTAILMDVASLATRLGKPLTARLMPIPGKQAGDETCFDFGYFANSRVMQLEEQTVAGLLGSADRINLKPRKPSNPF